MYGYWHVCKFQSHIVYFHCASVNASELCIALDSVVLAMQLRQFGRRMNARKPVPIGLNNRFVSLLIPRGIDTGFVHLALFADGTIICVRWW